MSALAAVTVRCPLLEQLVAPGANRSDELRFGAGVGLEAGHGGVVLGDRVLEVGAVGHRGLLHDEARLDGGDETGGCRDPGTPAARRGQRTTENGH